MVPGRQRFGPTFIELEHLYLTELKQVSKASFQVNLGIEELVDPQALFAGTTIDDATFWSTLYPGMGPPQNHATPATTADPDDPFATALFGDSRAPFGHGFH